ncbi:MAG: recombination mediator RecR [Chitinophagales bacterium]|nr:recombination mediator RecR [Chitinophagales bacterium]MDW8273424.1 recombination mediator RecR [Chitinophagales bacterium]
MIYSSKYIAQAVAEFKKLPGIGEKTALRLVLHLLKQDMEKVKLFSEAISNLSTMIKYCSECHNISDEEICPVCKNPQRDRSTICVVETIREVIAIENTGVYNGVYHVLGGLISPIDGVGPESLNIDSLIKRAENQTVREIIMALSPTMDGDTTIFFISKKIADLPHIKITSIARGVSFGGELEYTDELTLARSIATRTPYEFYLVKS